MPGAQNAGCRRVKAPDEAMGKSRSRGFRKRKLTDPRLATLAGPEKTMLEKGMVGVSRYRSGSRRGKVGQCLRRCFHVEAE
jgi:hypothetical protein